VNTYVTWVTVELTYSSQQFYFIARANVLLFD